MDRRVFWPLVAGVALGLSLTIASAVAGERPRNDFVLFVRLNGEPSRLGVLTSTGTSVNQGTTATPFTIPSGAVLKIICDVKAFVTVGTTASANYTATTLGHPVLADTPYYVILQAGAGNADLASISAGGTTNCTVWNLL